MIDFIVAVLDDDSGFSERVYKELCKLEENIIEQGFPEIKEILDNIKSIDGRYFLSKEFCN